MLSGSRRQKRVVTHLVTFGVAALLVAILYFFLPVVYPPLTTRPGVARQGTVPLFRISISTGYVSVLLLMYSLAIGPGNLLRKRRRTPAHLDLRRDVGIWAGVLALVHVGFGSFIHVRRDALSNVIYNFIYPPHIENAPFIRLGPFGWANHVGLIATLLIILLLAISNDYALRKLGTRRWKSLQRWTYYFVGLLAIHSVLYQLVEHRPLPFVVLFGVVMVLGLAIQLYGVRLYRRLGS